MACESKKYTGLTLLMMDRIRVDMQQMGMSMGEGHTGLVVHKDFGVEAEFSYHEGDQVLHVRITQKPFFVPCTMIYGRMDQAIARHQTGHDPMADR